MKTKEVILKLHLRSTSYEKIYFSFANYYIWLKCDFFNMVFGAHLFCCFLFFVFFLGDVQICVFTFWVPRCEVWHDFRIEAMFGSSLPPVVCVMWCPTHFVFFICLSSSCMPYATSFSGFLFLIAPWVFSNVYFHIPVLSNI